MAGKVKFEVFGNQGNGRLIQNKVSVMNEWDFREMWMEERPEGAFHKANPFVECVQFMTATGGSVIRDLFKDPLNFEVMDDYDFEPLITACGNLLRQNVIPFIKTGNIPLKYSAYPPEEPEKNVFRVNIFAPKDYQVYYNYIHAMAQALVDAFGLEEVKTWRWGVFTEYENADWFIGDPTRKSACEAFLKIYDYTVGALTNVLGDEIYIGAHSMTNGAGENAIWEEQELIKHCAQGPNYENGSDHTRMCYMASSFYDDTPNQHSSKSMLECIGELRECAESVGLKLDYGIDEGRILFGTDGLDLVSRVVGHTFQAGFDANIYKEMIDHDISWFATWDYLSGTKYELVDGSTGDTFNGLPTVSYHVASCFHKMVGAEEVKYEKVSSDVAEDIKADLITAYDKEKETCYVMGYCYKHELDYNDTIDFGCSVELPWKAEEVSVTKYMIDDTCNFYPKWRADADAAGLENNTGWSRDSAQILMPIEEEKYEEYSRLIPTTFAVSVENGKIGLQADMTGNAVVMFVIEKK